MKRLFELLLLVSQKNFLITSRRVLEERQMTVEERQMTESAVGAV